MWVQRTLSIGEGSLFSLSPDLLHWIWPNKKTTESKPVKQETSWPVILPTKVSVLCWVQCYMLSSFTNATMLCNGTGPQPLSMVSNHTSKYWSDGSPGLVVMGGDSCSKDCEFESWLHILDGHFPHLFVVKIIASVWKDENKWKRGRGWPI